MYRERRSWTEEEDRLLRDAVDLEEPGSISPSKWHAIAKHVPNRTNKDCRKRWFAKMASDVVKGGWAPEEDERLVRAIEKYGTRWSLVAACVDTRNSDQCAKRWCDTLNPSILRTRWSAEADTLLLNAVQEHGKLWTKIVRKYFPGRTGLAAKNRYNSLTRFNTRSPHRKSYKSRCESEISSSSFSNSPSVSSAPDTPEQPSSFELNAADSDNNITAASEFVLDSSTWPPGEASTSRPATLVYDELRTATLSSTGLVGEVPGINDYGELQPTILGQRDQSSPQPWDAVDEIYSIVQHATNMCPTSPIQPISHCLEPYELIQNLGNSNTGFSSVARSPMLDAFPFNYNMSPRATFYQADEQGAKILDYSHVLRNECGYETIISSDGSALWRLANMDSPSFFTYQ
ncbi:hypothetical protein BT96DRAFT_488001 [Gymnopus androsaceus JB14]|uniref:Homeodomain-like protein n=1 Tax=Gymnopus androsaceus JB14 TaxID=1447944 RepID=A0A6A4GNS7_9AGAR|nr:hypothetical protein BT96DRAFT_488001 [Gymnopus androsaceus JB14]